jgi:hypothetical protein
MIATVGFARGYGDGTAMGREIRSAASFVHGMTKNV